MYRGHVSEVIDLITDVYHIPLSFFSSSLLLVSLSLRPCLVLILELGIELIDIKQNIKIKNKTIEQAKKKSTYIYMSQLFNVSCWKLFLEI